MATNRLARCLEERREPGAAELCDLLQAMLGGGPEVSHEGTQLERLQKGVYRLRIGGSGRTLVVKRHTPAAAEVDRLVAERWLPALGLGECCPRLLGAAAERDGRWVWHAYEDLGAATLADRHERRCWEAVVDLVAELHSRGTHHRLLPEVRWHGRDHRAHSLIANLRDSIALLDALRDPAPPRFATACRRLLERLHKLLEEAPAWVRMMDEVGGADTLLHGDLWPKNAFVAKARDGGRARVRLVDWDHVGVGSFSYDVSTFLYHSQPEDRPWLWRRYRSAVERDGVRLPADRDVNRLFHAAETARGITCIIWPAMALLHDGAEWGRTGLVEIEDWFAALRPPLPDAARGAA
ncbi:MAG TPA: phosphotransferase [Gemmatimonadales bacterium]|nr:phosphotransferase [Gemmatimonadales bacterium]